MSWRDVIEAINFDRFALLIRCGVLAGVLAGIAPWLASVFVVNQVALSDILYLASSILLAYGAIDLASYILFATLEPLGRTPVWSLYFYASSFADGPLTFGVLGIVARNIIQSGLSAGDLGDKSAYDTVLRLCVVVAVTGFLSGIRRFIVKSFTVRMAHRDYVERCVSCRGARARLQSP